KADLSDLQFESGTALRLGAALPASVALAPEDEGGQDSILPVDAQQSDPERPVVQPIVTPLVDDAVAPAQPLPAATQTMLGWTAPAEVKVGEQCAAVVNVSAVRVVEPVTVMLGFSPHVLQAVSVEEGGFMRQGGGQSSLPQQVNLSEGRMSATVSRQGSTVSG